MSVLTVQGVTKVFGGVRALDRVNLKVEKGVGRYIPRPTYSSVFDRVKTYRALNAPRRVERAQAAE